MSKFDRYQKKGVSSYIYPHKHCSKCGEMIDESLTYCSQCYLIVKQRKKRKLFGKKRLTEGARTASPHQG